MSTRNLKKLLEKMIFLVLKDEKHHINYA